MAKTKTTPKSEYRRCPMCSRSAGTEEEYKEHVLECAMRTFQCPYCDFNTTREVNVKRHVKRCHPGLRPNEDLIQLGKKAGDKADCSASTTEKRDEDWLTQDPGDLIGDLSPSPSSSSESDSGDSDKEEEIPPKETLQTSEPSLLEGRLIRKKTMPSVPFTKKRSSQSESSVPEKKMLMDRSVQVGSLEKMECEKVDRGTQTSPKRRVMISTTIKKNRQGDTDVKVITKEKIIFK